MTTPNVPLKYMQQIEETFEQYNNINIYNQVEFFIKNIETTGFSLIYVDKTTRFQFDQLFWYTTITENTIPTKIKQALLFYQSRKSLIELLCDMYGELAEIPWRISFQYQDKNDVFHDEPNFLIELIKQDFHNEVQLRITPQELSAFVYTLMPREDEDSVIKHTESILSLSKQINDNDIENLIFDVLTKDLTYQFKKHFGDKLLDY